MKAKDMQTELELMVSRNLKILVDDAGEASINGIRYVATSDVRAMLKAIAANIAQAYAGRVHREDCDGRATGICECAAGDREEENGPSDAKMARLYPV